MRERVKDKAVIVTGAGSIGPGWGNIYCSEAAHINTSEANAAGFLGGGLKLVPVAGPYGRIDPAALRGR